MVSDFIYNRLVEMSQQDRIDLLEKVHKNFPYDYDLATMSPTQRKFHDAKAKREQR